MGKVVKGIGKAIKKIKPLKLIGGLAKGASKVAGFVPGVGTLASAALGAGGSLLSGEGVGGALKHGLLGAVPGVLKGVAAKAGGGGGFGGILKKGLGILGGKGLPGSKGSLIGQLATAVPGVIGAIQKGKQTGKQNRLLEQQAALAGEQAGAARGLLEEAAPLRRGAQAALMGRLAAGRPEMAFASDRLNPFTPQFNPSARPPGIPVETTGRVLPRRPRRRLLPPMGGTSAVTPYLNAAVR